MKKEKGLLRKEIDRIFGLSEEYTMMPLSSGQFFVGTSIILCGVMIVGIPLGLTISEKKNESNKDDINKTIIETETTEQPTTEELLNKNNATIENKETKYSYKFNPNTRSTYESEYNNNLKENNIIVKSLRK